MDISYWGHWPLWGVSLQTYTYLHLKWQWVLWGRYGAVECLGHTAILRSLILDGSISHWPILHYHQQHTRILISLQPCQHLSSVFLCISVLMNVQCISPFYAWCFLGDDCFGASSDVFGGQLSIHLGKCLLRPSAFGFTVVFKVLLHKALW